MKLSKYENLLLNMTSGLQWQDLSKDEKRLCLENDFTYWYAYAKDDEELRGQERAGIMDARRVRKAFEHVFSMWHNCALPEAERGIPKGTLCDDCKEYIDSIMKDLING